MRPRIEEFQNFIARVFPSRDNLDKKIRAITIQVTDDCNLRCTYCYQINKKHHIIPFETATKFLDLILTDQNPYINTSNSYGFVLDFIGGEPLLAVDIMDQITEWVIRRMIELQHPWLTRFRISISTNGTLYFDPKVQDYLKKYGDWISLSVSIDGNKELHDACRVFEDGSGSYDIAMAASMDWRARGNDPGCKMTLSIYNIMHTFNAVKNLVACGYNSIFMNCVFEEGWEMEHARIQYSELNKITDWLEENGLLDDIYISMFDENFFKPMGDDDNLNWCGGTGDMIAVDYKGDIYPCLRYMESSLGDGVPPIIIGTVDGGIEATPEQQQQVKCMQCITRRSQSTDECYNCPIAKGCAWCSAYNYQTFGTQDKRATFICLMHKSRAIANLYFWAKYNKFMNITTPIENHVPDEWAIEIVGEDEWNKIKEMIKS